MPSSLIVADTEERAALRDAVATLVGRYGHDYFMRKAAAHEEPTELWKELGAAGFWACTCPRPTAGAAAPWPTWPSSSRSPRPRASRC